MHPGGRQRAALEAARCGFGEIMKLKLVLLAVVVVLAALYFNSGFINAPQPPQVTINDTRGVMEGYRSIHSPADLAATFFGPWMVEDGLDKYGIGGAAYRPISSFVWYGLITLGHHAGWVVVSWLTFAGFAASCLLVAALAYRLTRSLFLAVAAGAMFSDIGYWCPKLPGQAGGGAPWLFWWPVWDQLLVNALILSSLVAFRLWQEAGERKCKVLTWSLFVAACFTKETAYGAPALIAALALLPSVAGRREALKQSLLMGAVSVGFFVFRMTMIGGALYGPRTSRLEAVKASLHGWVPPTPYQALAMPNGWALFYFACYAAAGVGAWLLWKYRGAVKATLQTPSCQSLCMAAALWLAVQAAYIPVLGFDYSTHCGILPAALRCVFAAVALQAVAHVVTACGRGALRDREVGTSSEVAFDAVPVRAAQN